MLPHPSDILPGVHSPRYGNDQSRAVGKHRPVQGAVRRCQNAVSRIFLPQFFNANRQADQENRARFKRSLSRRCLFSNAAYSNLRCSNLRSVKLCQSYLCGSTFSRSFYLFNLFQLFMVF